MTREFGKAAYKTGIKVGFMNQNCFRNLIKIFSVQHVALCPWFAETAIVDQTTKDLVLKKSPLKFVSVERVGEAFELAVREQR